MNDGSDVTILLALHNGTAHLEDQLQSYLEQKLTPIRVLASDDAPSDGTGALFLAFAQRSKGACDWELIHGPGQGLTANFLHLLGQVDPDTTDYVALSDQDDIWLDNKLLSAVELISPHGNRPVLLGTRSWEWYAEQNRRRLSRTVPEPWDFSHALVQNYAGGNTMVLNRAALQLVQKALACRPPYPAVHDWWLYQLISGAGGTILLDPTPQVLYRQHGENQIGANAGFRSKALRFLMMLRGTYRGWMDQNLASLTAHSPLLTPEAQALLSRLKRDRAGGLYTRLRLLYDTGLHRKGWINQLTLWIAAALNRI